MHDRNLTKPTAARPASTNLTRFALAAALGLAALTGAPDTASANWPSFKVDKDWSFMSFWKSKKDHGHGHGHWKDKWGHHDKVKTVPELDANASGQALVLVIGGVAVALGSTARKRKRENAGD